MVNDLDLLTAGIDLTETDVAWHTVMMTYPVVIALARRRGYNLAKLQGGHMPGRPDTGVDLDLGDRLLRGGRQVPGATPDLGPHHARPPRRHRRAAMGLRISCHSSGRTMTYQQPLNNIVRGSTEMLAALCGGVQSTEVCAYDEAIGIPTDTAREIAIRTQQIVAHEVGGARVVDPLGGRYYVEALTDKVEAEALRLLAKIEDIGIVKAVTDNVIEQWCEDDEMRQMQEMDDGERIVVGVNRFTKTDEPNPQRFTVDRWRIERHLKRFAETKATRNPDLLRRRMDDVYGAVRAGGDFHEPLGRGVPGRRHHRRGLGHGADRRRLRDRGAEVVYVGDHNTAAQLAGSAVAEDADLVGVSFGMARSSTGWRR